MAKERKFNRPQPVDEISRIIGFQIKLEANRAAGKANLLSGTFKPFEGFDARSHSNMYAFFIEPAPESQNAIMTRVVDPLREITKQNGIEAIFPLHGDMTPHITLDTAEFVNLTDDKREGLAAEFDKNIYFDMICKILGGLDFSMDTLVVAPTSYICAGEFGQQLYAIEKARRLIERVLQKTGETKVIDFRDILHSSVARITAIPEDKSRLADFAREAEEKVGKPLKNSPLEISASRAIRAIAIKNEIEMGGKIAMPETPPNS